MYSGQDLKVKRVTLGIKAKEIAEKLNINKSYISLMENGSRNIPSHIYSKWTDFLGLN